MLNHYPFWKNAMLLCILVIATVYALPNLFPEDPSVQISHDSGELPAGLKAQVESLLTQNKLDSKAVEATESQQLLVRFSSTDAQLIAADELKSSLDSLILPLIQRQLG